MNTKSPADYGVCCRIYPQIDFGSRNLTNMSAEDRYINKPRGVRNGVKNGLKILLDVEGFDYAYYPRAAKGFMVAVSDAAGKAIIEQQGKKEL